MKSREQHRLNNNWVYAQSLWSTHGLKGWTLDLKHMNDKIGVCDYNNKTIVLSSIYLRGANCNFTKTKKALMHEIAHAITPGHKHDEVWKDTCSKIGGDTRLAGSMNLPGMNWSLYCYKCKWRQEYETKPDINGKVCGMCKTQPRVRYIE